MPLCQLTLITQNERANLNKAERNMLTELVDLLMSTRRKE